MTSVAPAPPPPPPPPSAPPSATISPSPGAGPQASTGKKKWAVLEVKKEVPKDQIVQHLETVQAWQSALVVSENAAAELNKLTESDNDNCEYLAECPGATDVFVKLLLDRAVPNSLAVVLADVVHHLASCSASTRQHLVQSGVIPAVHTMLQNREAFHITVFLYAVKTLTMIAIEHPQAIADAGCVPYVVQLLSSENWSVRNEAAQLIGNLVFGSESLETLVGEQGAVAPLIKMLSMGPGSIAAAGSLWSLSFNNRNRHELLQRDVASELDKLLQSFTHELREANPVGRGTLQLGIGYIKGILFVIDKVPTAGTHALVATTANGPDTPEEPIKPVQVMLSYNWSHQELVRRIAAELKTRGIKVWLDVEEMSGSTLEAMAEAVEDADAVLMCMSDAYKQSQACRTEAEYAYCCKKPIVPLKVEQGHKATGWLGALLGSKLYFNFADRPDFDQVLDEVVSEVHRVVGRHTPTPPLTRALSSVGVYASTAAVPAAGDLSSIRPLAQSFFSDWTGQQVLAWLRKENLQSLESAFEAGQISGPEMVELACWLCDSRQYGPAYDVTPYLQQLVADVGLLLRLTTTVSKALRARS